MTSGTGPTATRFVNYDTGQPMALRDATNGFFTPQDFGAKGDGSTDDTAALQACINAANGAPIYLGNFTYIISAALTSNNAVNILGVGTGSGAGAALQSNNEPMSLILINAAGIDAFTITSVYPSTFRDFKIDRMPAFRASAGGVGIHLIGTGTAVVANYKIQNVGFTNVDTPIRVMRPQWGLIEGCYFDTWTTAAIYMETSSGVEGSGGFIAHNFLFGTSAMVNPAIYSEVGYTVIQHNEILGGNIGVNFNIKNNPAGFIEIDHNTIENFGSYGVMVESGDGSVATMVKIDHNELEDLSNTPTASIVVLDSTITNAWVTDVQVTNNISRNTTVANGVHLWIAAGKNVIVSGNVIDELSANSGIRGIYVNGNVTNAGLIAPIQILDNTFIGSVATRYQFAAVSGIVVRDLVGLAFANLPGNAGNGSQIYVSDGTAGSPLTGGGGGSMAFRLNGAWKGF